MSLPVPFQIGVMGGQEIGKGIERRADESTIDDLVERAKRTTGGIEQLLLEGASKIKDPARRQAFLQSLESVGKKKTEKTRVEEIKKVTTSRNPMQALRESSLGIEDKQKIADYLYQQSILSGNFPTEIDVSDAVSEGDVSDEEFLGEEGGAETPLPEERDRTPKKFNITKTSAAQLESMLSNKVLRPQAQAEINRRKDERNFRNENDALFRKNFQTRMIDLGNEVNQSESDMSAIEQAINDNDTSFWTTEGLKKFFNIEQALIGPGGQINSAVKDFFFGSLRSFKGRPNQFIEQMLKSALVDAGQHKDSQLIISRMMRNALQMKKAENRIRRNLFEKNKYEVENGLKTYGDLELEFGKNMETYANAERRKMMNDLVSTQIVYRNTKGTNFQKVTPGSRISAMTWKGILRKFNGDREKAESEAQKLGYVLR